MLFNTMTAIEVSVGASSWNESAILNHQHPQKQAEAEVTFQTYF